MTCVFFSQGLLSQDFLLFFSLFGTQVTFDSIHTSLPNPPSFSVCSSSYGFHMQSNRLSCTKKKLCKNSDCYQQLFYPSIIILCPCSWRQNHLIQNKMYYFAYKKLYFQFYYNAINCFSSIHNFSTQAQGGCVFSSLSLRASFPPFVIILVHKQYTATRRFGVFLFFYQRIYSSVLSSVYHNFST